MKIIVLSIFPVDVPRHGGQIRVDNIIKKYISLGHEVICSGISGGIHYPESKFFLKFPIKDIGKEYALVEDYKIGELAVKEEYYEKLVKLFPWEPDLIHVELPWMFKFAEKYVSSLKRDIPIIYGSENIEYKLKYDILVKYRNRILAEKYSRLIKELEIYVIKKACCCYAVSKNDEMWFKKITKKPVYYTPNGVSNWIVSDDSEIEFKKLKLPQKFALFCGSAHPPNMSGFFEIFDCAFGCLGPDEKLVVAGSVGPALKNDKRFDKIANLSKRIVVLGIISEDLLAALLKYAHCIILPITHGGGTNLKTAEAIWTGCHVIGTDIAFRGFEKFIGDKGINVTDNSIFFRRYIRKAMDEGKIYIDDYDIEKRKSLLWSECLGEINNCLSFLENN